MKQNLFRNKDGTIREILDNIEGISFKNSPLDFFILLARYKFAMRFLRKNHKVIDVGYGHGLSTKGFVIIGTSNLNSRKYAFK